MKLNQDFIVHEMAGETLLVPVGDAAFSGVARGNKTFGVILTLLKKETTREEILRAMVQRFDAPMDVIAQDVDRALRQLEELGALER